MSEDAEWGPSCYSKDQRCVCKFLGVLMCRQAFVCTAFRTEDHMSISLGQGEILDGEEHIPRCHQCLENERLVKLEEARRCGEAK